MKLGQVVRALERIAPLELAAPWDNVGLLLEPRAGAEVQRVLLTIDLTEAVLAEALAMQADLIVAYHPPIFAGLQRLTQASAGQRVVLGAAAAGVALYSPHTALDAVTGGVNDWLADGLGKGKRRPLEPSGIAARNKREGQGRLVTLERPLKAEVLLRRIKRHLKLSRLRVAWSASDRTRAIATVALCAGAGGALVGAAEAELLLTGEMRHHDVLAALSRGCVVVLTEHSNSERGYLPRLVRLLRASLGKGVEVRLSRKDCEPIAAF